MRKKSFIEISNQVTYSCPTNYKLKQEISAQPPNSTIPTREEKQNVGPPTTLPHKFQMVTFPLMQIKKHIPLKLISGVWELLLIPYQLGNHPLKPMMLKSPMRRLRLANTSSQKTVNLLNVLKLSLGKCSSQIHPKEQQLINFSMILSFVRNQFLLLFIQQHWLVPLTPNSFKNTEMQK